jgi:NAD(P)-dependent dehydrogenase (short-subunit alcohol dehydrogenase family)
MMSGYDGDCNVVVYERKEMSRRKAIQDRFRNKVAIVSGGSSGIGRATVEELCREGASVVFTGLELDQGTQAEEELKSEGGRALFLHGDMADDTFVMCIVDETVREFGSIHYLVNNAFSFLSKGEDATVEEWRRMYDVGPVAYARLGSRVAQQMRLAGGGAIVNISSISAFIAQRQRWTYNSAKGAVHNLTKCMALDLASYGIRVNSISPGWIWTREVLKAADGDREKWDSVWGRFHMLRRCGDPHEVAAAILFLLSDDASFITGADLPVDGGYQGLGSEGLGDQSHFAGSS